MSERRPYLRAQSRYWWVKPPYRAYTLRELCGVVLAAYAAILLIGLICLASGPEAYETYRRSLASLWSLLIHLVLLAAALWHVWTWFQILPKTITSAELQATMEGFTRQLGVKCVFCHVPDQYEKDDRPHKAEARRMIRLVLDLKVKKAEFFSKGTEDATLNPDTMDERRGGWGGLLALFRLIHRGHRTGFVQARGGKLFDPDEFPFLEGRAAKDEPAPVDPVVPAGPQA